MKHVLGRPSRHTCGATSRTDLRLADGTLKARGEGIRVAKSCTAAQGKSENQGTELDRTKVNLTLHESSTA